MVSGGVGDVDLRCSGVVFQIQSCVQHFSRYNLNNGRQISKATNQNSDYIGEERWWRIVMTWYFHKRWCIYRWLPNLSAKMWGEVSWWKISFKEFNEWNFPTLIGYTRKFGLFCPIYPKMHPNFEQNKYRLFEVCFDNVNLLKMSRRMRRNCL